MKPLVFTNLDANETIFFSRELEYVKKATYDIRYPEFKATALIPVSGDAGAGAESITYQSYDMVGMMKLIANYADDLPRSDVYGKEYTSPVKSIGGSYGYSIQEIRAAQMAGKPLTAKKATAVRRAYEQMINKIAWFADGSAIWAGLRGLIYSANTTKAAAVVGGWHSGGASADQIINDVTVALQNIKSLTKGVEEADTVLLPPDEYAYIAATPRSATSDRTILEWIQKIFPGVTFDWVNELADVAVNPRTSAATPTNLMICYKKSPDKLTLEIPLGFEQFNPQERGLEYIVPAHGRVGGVIIYYPLSISIIDGL